MFINRIRLLKFINKLTYLTAAFVSTATLISLFGRYPYLELFTHFRLQYAWLSLICIAGLSGFGSWKLALLMTVLAAFNAAQFIPYYYAAQSPENTLPAFHLRLMLANVQGNNSNYGGLIEAVKSVNPDIFVLQEVTDEWWANVQILSADYPYYKSVPRPGGSGLVLFSRYPIESAEVLTLDDSTHPALISVINLDGTPLTVFTMHPPTPVTARKFNYRNGQYAQAAALLKAAPEPKLLIGDLNTTMWSPYFTDLIENSGLRDARIGKGLYPSWYAILPSFLRIPIDHCLVGEKIAVENITTGDYTGSDHRPLIVDVKVEKQSVQADQ